MSFHPDRKKVSLRVRLQKVLRRFQFWKNHTPSYAAPKIRKNYVKRFVTTFWVFKDPNWSLAPKKSLFDVPEKPKLVAYLNPLPWLVWIPKFCFAWLISRPLLNVAPALPAIVATLAFCMLVFWDRYQGNNWRVAQYRLTMQSALAAENYDLAAIACRTLINLAPYDDNLRFQQALIELDLGHEDIAKGMMVDLASARKNPAASSWLLNRSFDMSKVAQWTADEHSDFLALVANAKRQKSQGAVDSTQLLFASYLAQRGAARDAVQIVEELVARNPKLNLIGLGLAAQGEDAALSRRFADGAVRFLEQFLTANPNAVAERLELARTLVFLEREQEAARVLQDGFELTQDESLKGAIADVLIHYSRRIAKQGDAVLVQRLQIIRNAMNYAPNNQSVIDAIVEIVLDCKDNKGKQVELLRESIVSGAAPEATHFIQGTLSLLNGDPATALNHLKIAQSTGINTPGLLNNMAMALQATDDPEKVNQALELSNSAISFLPEHPYLRDTRGQIFLKLQQYEAAIPDLEFALRSPELAGSVHGSLAKAYTALGQADLADEHRKLAVDAPQSESVP